MAEHPARSVLEAFATGRSTGASEARDIVRHLLAGCRRCRSIAREAALGSLAEPLPPEAYRSAVAAVRSRASHLGAGLDAEDRLSEELFEQLMDHPPGRQETILRNHRRYQTPGLVDRLGRESRSVLGEDPRRAAELARLAVTAADALADDRYPEALIRDARARARIRLSEALRRSSHLRASGRVLEEARGYVVHGPGDRSLEAQLAYKEAMLLNDQGRLAGALAAIDRAFRLYREMEDSHLAGKALINRGVILADHQRPAEAIHAVSHAAALVDPVRDPKLILVMFHNLALYFSQIGWLDGALRFLRDASVLYEQVGSRSERLRRHWLEGNILVKQGRMEEACRAFRRAQEGFIEMGLACEAAKVSLELAAAYAELGWSLHLRRLARQMLPIFRAQHLHREAMAALVYFCRSVEEDRAGVWLARAVLRFFEAVEKDPELVFEGWRRRQQKTGRRGGRGAPGSATAASRPRSKPQSGP